MHTCDNRKLVSWKKFELPLLSFIVHQLERDDICRIIAHKYNEFRKARIHGDLGTLEASERKLSEVALAIENIIKAIERGTASDSLLNRLASLETEKQSINSTIKLLRGMDQSQIYVTPTSIKMRFAEIPAVLQRMQPFEVSRALKPLIGKGGIRLEKRANAEGKEHYWVVGTINLARAMGLVENESTMDAASINHEIDLEMDLG